MASSITDFIFLKVRFVVIFCCVWVFLMNCQLNVIFYFVMFEIFFLNQKYKHIALIISVIGKST